MKATRILVVLSAVALAACTLDSIAPETSTFNAIAALSGTGQSGDAGSSLAAPLVVRVTNAKGKPLAGVEVAWTVTSGMLLTASTATDAQGIVRVYWTLGTAAGKAFATATAPGMGIISFSSTVKPGACSTLEVNAEETELQVGQLLTLGVTARDAYRNAIIGRAVSWRSSDPAIARVDSNGNVSALATGTATITATLEDRSASVTLDITSPTTTVVINNQLVRSINVYINSELVGVVNGFSSAEFVGPRVPLVVSYTLNRQTTTSGTPIGSELAAAFPTVSKPVALETFVVNNRIGQDTYFVPFISNQSSAGYLMGVNMGMLTEGRCNCVVPAGTANVEIGYYKLNSTSNVRAYAAGSSYTGEYVNWKEFSAKVGANTGYLPLSSSVVPAEATALAALATTAARPLLSGGAVHDDDAPFRVPQLATQAIRWRQTVKGLPGIVTNRPVER